jgi:hypothetical protein
LDTKLAAFRTDPQSSPSAEILRTSARRLFDASDKLSARKILEFVFAQEIEEHRLVAANFLGLAEIRIAAGDMPGALELLRRLVAAVGNPYENLDSSAALLEKTGHNAEAVEFLNQLVKTTPWEPAFRLRLAKAQIATLKDDGAAQDALAKLAAATDIPYGLRIEAALASSHSRSDLGSAELNLLAGAPRNVSAAAADQPFFYDARLRAAIGGTEAQVKIKLLSNALGDTPGRDDARIPLFQETAGIHSDEFALASIEQILHGQTFRRTTSPVGDEENEIITSTENNSDADGESDSTAGYVPAKLSIQQQAEVAGAIGNVLGRLNRWGEALSYFQAAQNLEKTPARRKEIGGEIANVKARLRRQQANAARQPILHADLEQDRIVRPRLVARADAPGKSTSANGEKP